MGRSAAIGPPDPHLSLNPLDVVRLVFLASAMVLTIGLARTYVVATYGTDTVIGNFHHFDFDDELTIPAWYSSIVLVACAGLLFTISRLASRTGAGDVVRWTLLGLIFAAMGVDEAVSVHERLIDPLREGLGVGGVLYFTWVIPGAIAVAAVGLYMLPFLFRLPARSAFLFITAGALYVGGALGMELVGGAIASQEGTETARYMWAVAVEETLEITGATLFLAALVDHMSRVWGSWALRIVPAVDRAIPAP